jgi:hypothetical protein
MQQLLENQVDQNNDDDSSPDEDNHMSVDYDSCSDIGYETDLTVVDADTKTMMAILRTTTPVISPSSWRRQLVTNDAYRKKILPPSFTPCLVSVPQTHSGTEPR